MIFEILYYYKNKNCWLLLFQNIIVNPLPKLSNYASSKTLQIKTSTEKTYTSDTWPYDSPIVEGWPPERSRNVSIYLRPDENTTLISPRYFSMIIIYIRKNHIHFFFIFQTELKFKLPASWPTSSCNTHAYYLSLVIHSFQFWIEKCHKRNLEIRS